MLKTLRKKLVAFYTVTTGLILTVVILLTMWQSFSVETQQLSAFHRGNVDQAWHAVINDYSSELERAAKELSDKDPYGESDEWSVYPPRNMNREAYSESALLLAKEQGCTIRLYQDGALLGQTAIQTGNSQEDQLQAQILNALYEEPPEPTNTAAIESYSGIVAYRYSTPVLRRDGLSLHYVSVSVVENLRATNQNLILYMVSPVYYQYLFTKRQLLFYFLLWFFGLLLLSLFGRLLISKSLRPVEENLQKQKEFIAAASHELKTPLAVIGVNASAIAVDRREAETRVPIIEGECARMGRLVQDLLFFTSSGAHSWSTHLQPLPLDTLLIELYDSYSVLCQKQGLTLLLELPETLLPSIFADKDRLKQAFSTLLDNAMRYAPEKSALTLRLGQRGRLQWVQVEDHGPGIPDSEKSLVFDRFYRGDKARSDKSHFGLGLSIAAEIVHLHHGFLEVLDTPGGGCTMQITLPTSPARRDRYAHQKEKPRGKKKKGEKPPSHLRGD